MEQDPKLNLPAQAHADAKAQGKELHGPAGLFLPGNPGAPKGPGRPKGRPNFWTELRVAIRKYRTPEGRKFFDALVGRAIVSDRLAATLLDKLFEDATDPTKISFNAIQNQGSSVVEDAVKELGALRRQRLEAAGLPLENDPPEL